MPVGEHVMLIIHERLEGQGCNLECSTLHGYNKDVFLAVVLLTVSNLSTQVLSGKLLDHRANLVLRASCA